MSIPPVVSWVVTARCNLSCPHCYVAAGKRPRAAELNPARRLAVAERLAAAGIRAVFLSGGEVLLLPDLERLLAVLCARGVEITVCTNGLALDGAGARRLRESGVGSVSISLDSALPAEHDAFRGRRGAYRHALEAVAAARRAGLRVNVDATPTRAAGRGIGALIWLCEQAGADHLTIKRFRPGGRGGANAAVLQLPLAEHRRILDDVLAHAGRARLLLDVQDPAFHCYARWRGADPALLNPAAAAGCLAARDWFAVQPDGTVTPCPLLPLALGNVLDGELPTIFERSPLVRSIRDRALRSGRCGRCRHAQGCGGCRAHAYAVSSDPAAEDPYCPMPEEALR